VDYKSAAKGAVRFCLLHPLLVLVPLEAFLLFWRIGLLTMWTDELSTLETVTRPVGEILKATRADVHPPLYFLLAHAWLRLPLPGGVMDRIRELSCVFTLIATFLLDRLWLAKLRPARRATVLLLWCLSPAVLLYGRMGRSYLMQTALVIVAVAAAWGALRRPGRLKMTGSAAALLAVLYTHYVPGIALFLAIGIALAIQTVRSRQARQAGLLLGWFALVLIGYLPWLFQLDKALQGWRAGANSAGRYSLTGLFPAEQALKAGYGFVSFSLGETFPFWALAAVPAIAILFVVSFRRLWRASRGLTGLLLLAAVIGYAGVARWVSYPFIPARLLWLLPFFLLWIALSPGVRPAARAGLVLFLVAADLASIVSYYQRENFRNRGYAVPLAGIAATVRAQSDPESTLLILDTYNTDSKVFLYYLADERIHSVLVTPETKMEVTAKLQDPRLRRFWSLRNTHDISPAGLSRQLEDLACGSAPRCRRFYLPYAGWERAMMRLAGIQDPPTHFYLLTECSLNPGAPQGLASSSR
jgi:hypothetical protein